jgi:putative transposase
LEDNIIEPCESSWLSCPVLHKKKAGGDNDSANFRLCIDYRALNKKTKVTPHSMPRIDFILSQLGKARVFTMIDLSMGYHQILIDPASKSRTAFVTPHRGSFQYNTMLFGLAAAYFTFQKVIDEVLR